MLLTDEARVVGLAEMKFAILSAVVVAVYLAIHMRSVAIAALGVLQTVMAFPLAYFFYRMAFSITFFSTLNLMAIFIVLGISADDLFVFFDAWRQSIVLCEPGEDKLDRRMALSLRRAAKAIFVTSLTTATAFVATALSEIVPISAFGYYSAILVVVDYLLTMLLFPPFLLIHN